jgi:hypothetical protein
MELIEMRKTFLFAAVLTGMVFSLSGSALAQKCDPKDPKCQPPKEGTPCSPGFYKKHLDFWVDIYCSSSSTPTCGDLLDALTCKGSDATCGRSDAAAFLNDVSGCTE